MKKTVIVTGASGNLGQAVVKKFLDEGYHVIGTAIPDDSVVPDTNHNHFEKITVDLNDEDAVALIIQSIINRYGIIDAAVLTVGGFAMGKIAETKMADVQKQYKLNFETAYNAARPIFEQMKKQQHGRIFMIGSRPGLDTRNAKGMIAYSLAKSLIFRLAELINEEARGTDVVAGVIVPATIDTPQNRSAMPDADFSKWTQPAAIADVIYFYCTPEAAVLREPVIKVYNNA